MSNDWYFRLERIRKLQRALPMIRLNIEIALDAANTPGYLHVAREKVDFACDYWRDALIPPKT